MNAYKYLIYTVLFIYACMGILNANSHSKYDISNPSLLELKLGEMLFNKHIKTTDELAIYLGTTQNNLHAFLATFPRYVPTKQQILTLDEALRDFLLISQKTLLKDKEYGYLFLYISNLANDKSIKTDDNSEIYKNAIVLGKTAFTNPMGHMGYSCIFCHKSSSKTYFHKNQKIANIHSDGFANKWPSYSMRQGNTISLEQKIDQHMQEFGMKTSTTNPNTIKYLIIYLKNENKDKILSLPSFSY